jgi:hypothetical protein
VFIGATEGDYFNERNLDALLSGGKVVLREKVDVGVREISLPVFGVSLGAGLSGGAVFSTCFTGHISGMDPSAGLLRDSVSGGSRLFLVNQPVLNLYAYILGSGLPVTANRRVLEVRDKGDYVRGGEYEDVWDGTHTYSFEGVAPSGVTREQLLSQLRLAMETDLGIRGGIEERKVEVLELRRVGGAPKASGFGREEVHLVGAGPVFLHHIFSSYLADLLNTPQDLPFVVDETGVSAAFDLELGKLPGTVPEWNRVLRGQGLCLVRGWRVLPVFVLRENRGDGDVRGNNSSNAKSR